MSSSLAYTLAAYGLALSAWSAVRAATGASISRGQTGAAVVLGAGSALQALLAGVALLTGRDVDERGILVAYLLASAMLLPLIWPLASGDETPWGSATLALACFALAVIALRALSIWQA